LLRKPVFAVYRQLIISELQRERPFQLSDLNSENFICGWRLWGFSVRTRNYRRRRHHHHIIIIIIIILQKYNIISYNEQSGEQDMRGSVRALAVASSIIRYI